MAAITIEEALKRFDRRFYSYHVNQDKLSIFSENVKRYVDMTIKAISGRYLYEWKNTNHCRWFYDTNTA